jgi:hypothetical protein
MAKPNEPLLGDARDVSKLCPRSAAFARAPTDCRRRLPYGFWAPQRLCGFPPAARHCGRGAAHGPLAPCNVYSSQRLMSGMVLIAWRYWCRAEKKRKIKIPRSRRAAWLRGFSPALKVVVSRTPPCLVAIRGPSVPARSGSTIRAWARRQRQGVIRAWAQSQRQAASKALRSSSGLIV